MLQFDGFYNLAPLALEVMRQQQAELQREFALDSVTEDCRPEQAPPAETASLWTRLAIRLHFRNA